jgi:phosphotransferase system enzyme I (PtsP)
VGFGADVRLAAQHGAEGVGLYRTEIPFLMRDTIPSRAEQVRLYGQVFAAFSGLPVVFRSLDLGGDKFLRTEVVREANPSLGYRSIRLSLDHPEEFITQVQAFQIAARGQDGRIMLPLVSSVSEVRRARELIREASRRLHEEGIDHHDAMPLGVMIEVPAAVEIAARLAREVAFFSIGTNDLVQYSMAVDRGNERVAHLGDPCHPAVLSLIRRTVLAAREGGVELSVCGEMAGNPATALLLIGLGVDRLSMNPVAIPVVKEAIREARHEGLRDRALGLLELEGPEDVRAAWPPLATKSPVGVSTLLPGRG